MQQLTLLMTRLYVGLTAPRERGDRGDVPGWVLITVMTVGLVAIISQVAGSELRSMLRAALRSVG